MRGKVVEVLPVPGDPARVARLNDLVERAQKGDPSALPGLREILAEPTIVAALGGDLASLARDRLLSAFAGKNLLFLEAVTRQMELLRQDLLQGGSSPLERLLVDRVVCNWLHLHHLENLHHSQGSMALELARHFEWCLNSVQKRYLAAIKALATVRRLAVPALQATVVNIAMKAELPRS
jgi:hypothetical protein